MSMLPPLILELRAKANEVYTEMAGVSKSVDVMEKKTGASMGRVEKNFQRGAAAGKLLAGGILIAGGIVAVESVRMASQFQSKMTLLQTAAGESAKNMHLVSDGILNLAGATGTSVEQLSEGMYTVEKSGNRGADGLKILKAAAEGAKAENVDLGIATNALTSVMMSYHEKASDAVKVQNEMIAGSGLAKTTMQEYASSLSAVLPVASSAGISFDQVAGAIATLTQHGTSAQESTQELANTIRSLQAPNQVASKMMQQLGLSVTDVSSGLGKRGLTGTIDLISNAIAAKMGPSGLVVVDTMKKSQAAAADARTELTKLPASLQDVAKGYLDGTVTQKQWRKELMGMTVDHRQLAQQFANTVNQSRGFNDLLKSGSPAAQTFAGTLNKVMGGATGMNTALMLGGENMAYFKQATEEVGAAGKKTGSDISTWKKTQETLAVQLAQVGHGIEAMGIRLGTVLIPFVSQAIKAGAGFTNWLVQNPPLLITFASIIGGFVVTMIGAYIAKLTMAAVQSLIQFGKMIAAGTVWIAEHTVMFAQAIANGALWVARSGAQMAAWLAKNAVVAAQGIVLWARYGAILAAQLLASAAKWVASAAATVGAMVAQNAAMLVQKAIIIGGAIAMGIATAAQWAWNVAMDANPIGLIILAIAALITIIVLVVTHWKEFSAFLIGAWRNIASFFVTVGHAIASWWNGFWAGFVAFARSIFLGYYNWLHGILVGVVTFFGAFGKALSNAWNGLWNGIGNVVRSVFNGVVSFIRGIFNGIIDMVNGVIGAINGVGSAAGAVGIHVGKIATVPHMASGGDTPGTVGQPSLAVVHGGEFMLSHDMLSGRTAVPERIASKVAASTAAAAWSGAPSAPRKASRGGGGVTVIANSNASPGRIAGAASWELRRRG